jgi:hypothetical protein
MSEPKEIRKPSVPYSRELADQMLELMADGCTLNEICRAEGMPSPKAVRNWAIDNIDGFGPRYARARAALIDYWADEIVTISDDGTNDYVERQNKDGDTVRAIDHDNIARSRLRVDSRKWLLSKLRPEQYGDKVELNGNLRVTPHEDRLKALEDAANGLIADVTSTDGAGGERIH